MESRQITSFVVRFQLTEMEKETGIKHWRIKVTHVQEECETLFDSVEEACHFMKEIAEEA
jgi:hypothetical protein